MSDNELAQKQQQEVKPVKPATKNGVAWLALLLSLATIALTSAGAWWLWQQQGAGANKQQSLKSDVRSLNSQLGHIKKQSMQTMAERKLLAEQFNAVEKTQQQQSRRLTELALAERDDWKLAEVEYLLRLAHQRVVLGSDVAGAKQLLQTADDILFELGYSDLYVVRKQLAKDIAAVSSIANTDNEGVYLQLLALAEQASQLPFSGHKELTTVDITAVETDAKIKDKLIEKLNYVWAVLKQLVVVKERTVDVQPLLSANQRQLVDARLKLNLAQARSALLLQQPKIYQASLQQAQYLVGKYYQGATVQSQTMLQQLSQLAAIIIRPPLPDVSGSQRVIKEYLNGRLVQKNPVEQVK